MTSSRPGAQIMTSNPAASAGYLRLGPGRAGLKPGGSDMATTAAEQPTEQYEEKGLKSGALGLLSSIVMGVASTAPAYSLAATLGFIAVKGGLLSPPRVLI